MSESSKRSFFKQTDDIDDAFDQVIMAENNIFDLGKEAASASSEVNSYNTGYNLGIDKGFELAQEMGFYSGFIEKLMMDLQSKEDISKRARTVVINLDGILKEFIAKDHTNELTDEKFSSRIESIRNKFKQAMSLLKLDVSYEPADKTSF